MRTSTWAFMLDQPKIRLIWSKMPKYWYIARGLLHFFCIFPFLYMYILRFLKNLWWTSNFNFATLSIKVCIIWTSCDWVSSFPFHLQHPPISLLNQQYYHHGWYFEDYLISILHNRGLQVNVDGHDRFGLISTISFHEIYRKPFPTLTSQPLSSPKS